MVAQVSFCVAVFLGGFIVAAFVCPGVIRLAVSFGLTDRPDGLRKKHTNSVPLGGGLAVFFAVVVVSPVAWDVVSALVEPDDGRSASTAIFEMVSLSSACLLIVVLGLVDDRHGVRGLHKLTGQAIAAGILISGGFYFEGFEFSGWRFDVGSFGVVLTLFWILGAINAVNLIDGADGVAATMGIGICGSLGILAAALDGYHTAIVPLAMSGALAGFLVYNFPPAKMYLGDSGSMLIGLVAAAGAIQSSTKSQATFALAAPVALLTIPIMDTSLAILRRKLTGRSIYDTDRGHLHHCLLHRGVTPRQVVFIVAALTGLTSLGAMTSIWAGLDMLSLLAIGVVLAVLVRYRVYGRGELALIWSRVLRRIGRAPAGNRSCVQIQGSRDWSEVWERVVAFATARKLENVRFSLSMPWLHEAFHGQWGDHRASHSSAAWRWNVPLQVHGRNAGWLEFVGRSRAGLFQSSDLYAEFIAELEFDLQRISGGTATLDIRKPRFLHSHVTEGAPV